MRSATRGPLARRVGRLANEGTKGNVMPVTKQELPRYFDGKEWRRVASYVNVARADIREPCALCGWGRHMAIHCKPEGTPPAGELGLHGWMSGKTPNVRGEA